MSSQKGEVFSPKNNVFTFNDGQSDTSEIKDPTFEVIVDLKEAGNAKHLAEGE